MTTTTWAQTNVEMVDFQGKKEEQYTYLSNDGMTVKFHAHPTEEWNWIIKALPSQSKHALKLVDAFCTAMCARAGVSIADATKTLTTTLKSKAKK